MAALIRAAAPRVSPCRWAVVLNTEAEFPAVRVLAMLTKKTGVTVVPFTNLLRAEEWLRENPAALTTTAKPRAM
jgi:hypothetical protein